MVNSLENIDKSKVSADRITGLDQKIQEELSTAVTGAASTIITSDLTANRALISNANGKVAVSSRTSGQLEGITGYYGTCSTANSTQTKDVVCANFVLETGASIRVKFTNYQNYNGVPKLNVNGTGAKEIKSIGTTNAGRYYWQAGEVIDFTYDGTYWLMDNGGIASTTYYGRTKLATGATNTSEAYALTPRSLSYLVQNMIEPYAVYSSSSTYAVGDRVRYNYQAWECNTAISTAESWTAAHWTALPTIQEQIDALPSVGGSSRNIGEIVASTMPLTDAGLHLLDGGVIQGGGAYNDFVTYIAGLVSSYPDLFCSEADWQTAITNYGVCGKFVYTSGSPATVRLPKITGFVEGTTDITALGDLIEAGLPNITGDAGANDNSGYGTGAFYKNSVGNTYTWSNTGSYNKLSFDASRSSSIYGNSTTVQPQSIKVLYYIVIATSTKTNIEVDIDEIATDLNGKVDKANLATCHVVVETYKSGDSWYRVYDDDWVEQGGYIVYPSAAAQTINLLKPYTVADYTILTGLNYTTNTSCYSPVINSKAISSFSLYIPYANNGVYWYACGMGA